MGIECGSGCQPTTHNTQLLAGASLTGLEIHHGDRSGVMGISIGSSFGASIISSTLGFLAQTFRL
jgi:hypothetical protein